MSRSVVKQNLSVSIMTTAVATVGVNPYQTICLHITSNIWLFELMFSVN